jgi:hypothetical protein
MGKAEASEPRMEQARVTKAEAGIDAAAPALKLPAIGRLGLEH